MSGYNHATPGLRKTALKMKEKHTRWKRRLPSLSDRTYFRNKSLLFTSDLDLPNGSPRETPRGEEGGDVYAVTAYCCLRPLRVIPGQVTVYTARANHVTDLSDQAPPPGCRLWRREAIKFPDEARGRQRREKHERRSCWIDFIPKHGVH